MKNWNLFGILLCLLVISILIIIRIFNQSLMNELNHNSRQQTQSIQTPNKSEEFLKNAKTPSLQPPPFEVIGEEKQVSSPAEEDNKKNIEKKDMKAIYEPPLQDVILVQ